MIEARRPVSSSLDAVTIWLLGAAVPESRPGPWLRLLAVTAAATTGVVAVTGALGAGLGHEVSVALALPPLVAMAGTALLAQRRLLLFAAVALGAVLVDVPLGAAIREGDHQGWLAGLHLAVAALGCAGAAAAAVMTFVGGREARTWSWRDYLTLTKPGVMALLLVTCVSAMYAADPHVAPLRVLLTVAGGALASGGASALNHLMDRDIDRLMGKRTSSRPVAAGRIVPAQALEFGMALSAFSFVLLASTVNLLAAVLALVGNLFYVLVYTRWLKRSTAQNIVIGGAAGAVPPLVGWAAATGHLSVTALAMFAIIFFWTPPHFWALALLIRRHYEAARVPMLPVVSGDVSTARQVWWYSLILVGLTFLPLAWRGFGLLYAVVALVLGGWLLSLSWRLRHRTGPGPARALYLSSLLYLALLFAAMAVDRLLGG
ncbi:MAG TPA: heme o synthase [Candidatus Dormibacteraeota bacterium]|nr:heme o synthase [Candidatus Dormibacteraeota bacterium]